MTALPPPKRRMGWVSFDLIVMAACSAFLFLHTDANDAMRVAVVMTGAFAFALMVRELTKPFEW